MNTLLGNQGVIRSCRSPQLIKRPLFSSLTASRSIGGPGLAHLRKLVHASAPATPRQHRGRDTNGQVVRAMFNDWNPSNDPSLLLDALVQQLKPVFASLKVALQKLLNTQKEWQKHVAARVAVGFVAVMALATAAANIWGVPAINRSLPSITEQAAHALGRDLSIGNMRWIAPTGIFGVTPLASIGPVAVGSGPVERSSATIEQVTVRMNPLESIMQGRIVLHMQAKGAEVHLKQCDNLSWFGYPEDTVPSARNFIPGLTPASDDENGKGKGGSNGGGGGGGESQTPPSSKRNSGAAKRAAKNASHSNYFSDTQGSAALQASAAPVSIADTPSIIQQTAETFLERIAQELLVWQEQQDAALPAADCDHDYEPELLLMAAGAGSRADASKRHQQRQRGGLIRGSSNLHRSMSSSESKGGGQEVKFAFNPFTSSNGSKQSGDGSTKKGKSKRSEQIAALNAIQISSGEQQKAGPQQLATIQPDVVARRIVPAEPVKLATPAKVLPQNPDSPSNTVAQQAAAKLDEAHRAASPDVDQSSTSIEAQTTASSSSHDNTANHEASKPAEGWLGGFFQPRNEKSVDRSASSPAEHQVEEETAADSSTESQQVAEGVLEMQNSFDPKQQQQMPEQAHKLNNDLQPIGVQSSTLFTSSLPEVETTTFSNVNGTLNSSDAAIDSSVSAAQAEGEVAGKGAAEGPATADTNQAIAAATSPEALKEAVAQINALPELMAQIKKADPKFSDKHPTPAIDASAVEATVEEAPTPTALPPAPPPEPSIAAKQINALSEVGLPTAVPKGMDIVGSNAADEFSRIVVDPSTLRRKGGSKALQAARNWQPVKTVARTQTSPTAQPAVAEPSLEKEKADVAQVEDVQQSAGDAEVVVAVAEKEQPSEAAAHATGSGSKNHAKFQFTHPGYFSPSHSPAYTPAPPEALAGRRARQRTLGSILKQALAAALSQIQVNAVAVGGVEIKGATLHAYIAGEDIPRVFENLSGTVRLGKNYDSIDVNVTAYPHKRDPASDKCTLLSPHAHRHLRHVTGRAALQAGNQNNNSSSSTVVESASLGPSKGKPQGGKVQVKVTATGIMNNDMATNGPRFPYLYVSVKGTDLYAPLVERIIELPMDINAGRANGELIIKSHDKASWHFPEIYGRVGVKGADFHFWDATDDILGADLDLVFEKDRVYMHNAKGHFGSVPMTLTGDLDLDPATGHYRLSANVPSVEVNQLRATLGVRPTPFPVVGAVSGTLHITGPLEEPVFSGTASVIRPTDNMLADCEPSNALEAILAEPAAVAAYDKVPIASAIVVFELDTATDMMTLHSIRGSPVGGGNVQGSGSMWVAPEAEIDPSAVSIEARGSGLPAEAVARQYLPVDTKIPPGMTVGPAIISFSMQGSHLAPVIDIGFKLPEAAASGTVRFTRDATSLDLTSPYADAAGTVFVCPPEFDVIKEAITQAQAIELAKPDVTGCDVDVTLRGLDVLPLFSDEAAMRQLAQQSGQPVRLRVNGHAKVSGKVRKAADADEIQKDPWTFEGNLSLEEVRLNQLKLFKKLTGGLKASESGITIQGRGLRADETLDVNLSLPLLPNATHALATEAATSVNAAEGARSAEQVSGAGASPDVIDTKGGSALSLRCGQFLAAADMNAKGSRVDMRVANLRLDELELASLRGEVQEVSCSLNFEAQTGRGKISLLGPRYSGLSGESLSGGFRWEKDVVRLEKFVLQQKLSKYEVQGEYVVPPSVPLPTSAADLTRQAQQPTASGRWRIRVDVPNADMQEIVPAARLLQDVASQGPSDYERAKTAFMGAVRDLEARAQELNAQLRTLIEQAGSTSAAPSPLAIPAVATSAANGTTDATTFQLPSVREVKGQWNGSVQAFGGGVGATSCEFDVKGQGWQWGSFGLESVVADGSYHSEEGVQLNEFVLKTGDAKLLLRGSLLSDKQDASILVTDFPMATLRPLFRAVPALQHVAPAVAPKEPAPIPSPRPLGMLVNAMAGATQGALKEGVDTDSPINGLLYVSGNLGGSKEQPTGEIAVRLYEGAVGNTRLAQAQASARLSENLQLAFNVDVVPAEGHRHSGHVRAGGVVPLAELDRAMDDASATNDSAPAANKPSGPMDVRLSVRDSGMAILTSVTPDFRWLSGEADVAVQLTGTMEKPTVTGTATLSKATIDCPFLKYPLTVTTAEAHCEEGLFIVEALEAKVGRKGHVRVRGVLPVYQKRGIKGRKAAMEPNQQRLTVDVQGLELRLRNMYSGQYDALLTVRDSLERPLIGGSTRFSRGTIFIMPQNAPDVGGALGSSPPGSVAPGPSVARVFELLTRGESGLAQKFDDIVRQEVEAVEHIVEETAGSNVTLDSLALQFGPDLRAMYPLVMNFSLAGEVDVSGPAHPDEVQVKGVVRLLGGEVNLVATQLELNREHPNTVVFGGPTAAQGAAGLDPLVDVVLTGGDLRVTITGPASEWADHLVLQSVRQSGGKVGGDAGEQLDAAEAARLFESKLKSALLADDGQLALSRLAGTTVSTLMPKIETQGQVGGAKWRLVSAPAIPGLLDPTLADPSNLLSSITMGTEVEVQFGRKLQAAMVRKLRDSDITTQWTLNYNLNSKLRMQFNISSAAPYAKTLMFQYSDFS